MRQQDTGHCFVIKTVANFSLEGFRQDEVFKAHAFTQRHWHPVAKLSPKLTTRFNWFTILVQHAPHTCPV